MWSPPRVPGLSHLQFSDATRSYATRNAISPNRLFRALQMGSSEKSINVFIKLPFCPLPPPRAALALALIVYRRRLVTETSRVAMLPARTVWKFSRPEARHEIE